MKVNLHKLACELAKMDTKNAPSGYNESVIGAETTLKTLGQKLRASSPEEAFAIVNAIIERSGK